MSAVGMRLPDVTSRPLGHHRGRVAAVLFLLLMLNGCASTGATRDDVNDPWEPFNRSVFKANMAVDRAAIKPVAKGYRFLLPQFIRDRLRDFFNNLTEPRIFMNDFLQVRINAAGITFTRFLTNSTIGLLGFFDWASSHKLPRQTGDFGQTLYRWGVADGPYLVIPLLGPSNVRDAVGLGGDFFIDYYVDPAGSLISSKDNRHFLWGRAILDGIDTRSRNIESLEQLEATSLDLYAQLRSIMRQRRQVELDQARGKPPEAPPELSDPGESPH